MPVGPPYDLLLTGGEVLDPGQPLKGRRDIAITKGTIVAVAEHIDSSMARQVLNLRAQLVTPGLIDLHGHYYTGALRGPLTPM
jgi:dihydroorotase